MSLSDNFATNLGLWDVIDAALVDVWILVNLRDRVDDRIVVELCLVVVHVHLHLRGLLNRAAQFIVQSVGALFEGVECRIEVFQW